MQATLGTPEFWESHLSPCPCTWGDGNWWRWYHQLRPLHLDLGHSQALNPTIHQAWLPCPIPACILTPPPPHPPVTG